MKFELRPYQSEADRKIREAFFRGVRRVVLVAPTGSGKTVQAGAIIEGAVSKGNRVVFLAHRKELIQQCSDMLDEIGIDHGVIKANHWRKRPDCPVQVASVQTLASKKKCKACNGKNHDEEDEAPPCAKCGGTGKVRVRKSPDAKVVIIDETHRCLAPSYTEIVEDYPDALLLGLSATPWRLDGRGLGAMYEEIVATVDVAALTEMGFLLPLEIYAPEMPDLSGVRRRGGDYDTKGIAQVMGQAKVCGKIVEHWFELGEGRRTVCFAASVDHSKDLAQRFREAGVAAEHVDGKTPDEERDAVLRRLAEGTTRIVCNCDILVEGYDLPSLGCAILARPTLSLTRYLQQVGRIMRPHADQTYAVLIDHAGCVHEHGEPTVPRRWSLDDRKKEDKTEELLEAGALLVCEKCGRIRRSDIPVCPKCSGFQAQLFKGIPAETDERLVKHKPSYVCPKCESTYVRLHVASDLEIRVKCRSCEETSYVVDKIAAKKATMDRRRDEFQRLEGVRLKKGFSPGWSAHKFREIFGAWPPRTWR